MERHRLNIWTNTSLNENAQKSLPGTAGGTPLRTGRRWELLPMPYRSPIHGGIDESEFVGLIRLRYILSINIFLGLSTEKMAERPRQPKRARRGGRLQRIDQILRRGRDRLHGGVEGGPVGLRGFVEAADLAHILQRSRVDFIRAGGRLEMVEGLDVAAHGRLLLRKC